MPRGGRAHRCLRPILVGLDLTAASSAGLSVWPFRHLELGLRLTQSSVKVLCKAWNTGCLSLMWADMFHTLQRLRVSHCSRAASILRGMCRTSSRWFVQISRSFDVVLRAVGWTWLSVVTAFSGWLRILILFSLPSLWDFFLLLFVLLIDILSDLVCLRSWDDFGTEWAFVLD